MRIAVLSDAHVDHLDDPVQAELVSFLERLRAQRLVILGDLFHRYWDWEDAVFSAHVPTLAALHALARRKVAITWLAGNHDFTPRRFATRLGIATGTTLDLVLDGRRYHLAHGDQADRSAGYRLTRSVLRSRAFAAFLGRLHPDAAWRLLGRLAGPAHRDADPPPALVRQQEHYARTRLKAGAHYVVLGHSHRVVQRHWPEGAYFNAGAFDRHRQVLWLESGREPRFASPGPMTGGPGDSRRGRRAGGG